MPNRVPTAGGVVAVLLLAAPAARAHVVNVDWKVTDAELVVVAYFNNDLPADDAEVTLHGPDGTLTATGKTDDTGTWKVPKPPAGTYRLTVKASAGHEKTVQIDLAPPEAGAGDGGSPSGSTRTWLIAGAATALVAAVLLALWVRWKRRGEPTPVDATG